MLGVPFVDRSLRIPGTLVNFSFQAGIQTVRLVEHLIIEINRSGVLVFSGKIPVAIDVGRVRIIVSENRVGDPADPDIALIMFPVFDLFRSGDDCAQRFCAPVSDPRVFFACAPGIDIFPVDAGSYQHFIARMCRLCGVIDKPERSFFCAVAIPAGSCIYIDDHFASPFPVFSYVRL